MYGDKISGGFKCAYKGIQNRSQITSKLDTIEIKTQINKKIKEFGQNSVKTL